MTVILIINLRPRDCKRLCPLVVDSASRHIVSSFIANRRGASILLDTWNTVELAVLESGIEDLWFKWRIDGILQILAIGDV